ncbi:uncharacterized protein [Lolium perenne]|uniref:uncharacterized protein n=1 Tax=Lolium perenne TaxID=4522 RepID=UPI0021F5B735|nr:uncharacterized protein LOC127313169 [Lolium perenne]
MACVRACGSSCGSRPGSLSSTPPFPLGRSRRRQQGLHRAPPYSPDLLGVESPTKPLSIILLLEVAKVVLVLDNCEHGKVVFFPGFLHRLAAAALVDLLSDCVLGESPVSAISAFLSTPI